MIRPGKYRAVTRTTIEHCHGGGYIDARVVEYATYEPGEEFEVPASVNHFFYRVMWDREDNVPMGRFERAALPPAAGQSTRYIEVCKQLGFSPEVHFVKLNPGGSIGFTAGKPDEIRSLLAACERHGLRPSRGLRDAAKLVNE